MMSRQSSCESLGSCMPSHDISRLNSELPSAYTTHVHTGEKRTPIHLNILHFAGVLSPSDLPDSPCASPTRNLSNTELDNGDAATDVQTQVKRHKMMENKTFFQAPASTTVKTVKPAPFSNAGLQYPSTSEDDRASAMSALSGLTIDRCESEELKVTFLPF